MQDVELLQAALEKASAEAMKYFRKPQTRHWHKDDGSHLTEADLAVNTALQAFLRPARPDYGWLSEEGPEDSIRLGAQRTWILDPIDGTRSFALGRGEWCIGLCLVEHGEPVAAGVVRPSLGLTYLAEKGKGATCNGKPIHVNDGASLKGAKIAARSGAAKPVLAAGVITTDVSYTPQITRMAMLAAGEVDLILSFGPKHDWDLAPGALLVTEAGGKVTDEKGQPLHFNKAHPQQLGLVAAGKSRHEATMKYLERG